MCATLDSADDVLMAVEERARAEEITEALNRIYSREDSSLDPVLAALQTRALPRDDWWRLRHGALIRLCEEPPPPAPERVRPVPGGQGDPARASPRGGAGARAQPGQPRPCPGSPAPRGGSAQSGG